ncbi:MAG TPA: CoA transferase [Methylomirabilota bacterium]|jgi:crotonobetainyl-CoA:carnitine CoA-transferase CaiB-like acyl-CoA transferase|nr:CoA transferase [Methylomirabilota bacterium]
MEARRRRALEGIRILDFTWVVAGPVATRILADQGAEVIKIERRDSLDLGSRRGGFTGNLFRGKESMVINMAEARGREIARELVKVSDVVIDNFSARVMHNWEMDYESIRKIKPDIIAVSMSGFGHTGPQKDYVSYGPTLQALSGYTLLMRHPEGEPAGWGYSYADMSGGYSGALAVLMALWHRKRTGEGQFVDLSQFETISSVIGPALLDILVNKNTITPFGNRSQEAPAAPHGVYRCAGEDRWCAITVFTDKEWRAFCQVVGNPAWTKDTRFTSLDSRLAHQDELDRQVETWTQQHTAEEVMTLLQQAGVAAGMVANGEDLDRDPQLRARGYWAQVQTPEGDEVILDGTPIKLSATPGYVAAPGPLLGEHTEAVLKRLLGYSDEYIAQLRAERVVASNAEIMAERQAVS